MRFLHYFVTVLFIAGCSGTDTADSKQELPTEANAKVQKNNRSDAPQEDTEMLTITGTIVHKNLEGGFFGLDANDGKKYMPKGMNKELLRHGMIVQVKGYVLSDVLTFQQYGEVLKVVEAIKVDDSNTDHNDTW
ncbi:hypothetical protein [Aliiglaciecola lipolytica]|uniref:Uncharacterized protein n=1 Tax=Aliiglaciecola lipolytica E3 TaxID=1127673 RepID=K6Y5L6_9ALTE|nr:hypothetical protein [Aliiglaciecola lipolytica]GAC13532.1 hypothetical protein GLIP_0889 [Aliiglaciecola lipolytica E3]